jgi:PAS domain S-box-containing protein
MAVDGEDAIGKLLGSPISKVNRILQEKNAADLVFETSAQPISCEAVVSPLDRPARVILFQATTLKHKARSKFRVVTTLDVTEQRLSQDKHADLLRQVDSINSGVVITDPSKKDNPIIWVNQAFERMTGYSTSEIVGRNCRFLQGEDRDPRVRETMRSAIQNNNSFSVRLRNYKKDGTPFINELHVSPVFDENKNLSAFIGIQNEVKES